MSHPLGPRDLNSESRCRLRDLSVRQLSEPRQVCCSRGFGRRIASNCIGRTRPTCRIEKSLANRVSSTHEWKAIMFCATPAFQILTESSFGAGRRDRLSSHHPALPRHAFDPQNACGEVLPRSRLVSARALEVRLQSGLAPEPARLRSSFGSPSP